MISACVSAQLLQMESGRFYKSDLSNPKLLRAQHVAGIHAGLKKKSREVQTSSALARASRICSPGKSGTMLAALMVAGNPSGSGNNRLGTHHPLYGLQAT